MNLSLIVRISFTSAAPATMPLPFTLSSRLSRIRLSLWLVLLCHACTSRCVGNSCSLLRCNPSPGRRRHRLTATHVSTWLMASGHVPRSQSNFFQNYGLGVEPMIWSLKQITGVICTALDRPQLRTSRFGPQMRSGRKTLLTLENCGEPDSHLRPGFSRSIGKTDNTQRPRPRASAIRELVPRAAISRGLRMGH